MNMKRTLALVLTIAICATMALGGTLAYLTDTEKAVNVMTVGSVEIEMNEQERVQTEDGYTDNLQDFTQNQMIIPAVDGSGRQKLDVNGYEISIRNNVKNYVDKIVTVKNTGIVDAYVRTIIATPSTPGEADNNAANNWFHWNGVSDSDTPNAEGKKPGWIWAKKSVSEKQQLEPTFDSTGDYSWPGNNPGWNRVDDVMIGGREYDLFIATNINVIEPGESTAPSLVGFYLDEKVDAERLNDGTLNHFLLNADGTKDDLGDLTNLKVYVATQAVQADGFADAWTALDKAFGEISKDNHPWMTASSEALTFTSGTHDVNNSITLDPEGTATDCVAASGENTVVNILGGTYDAANKDTAVWAYDGATINIYDGSFTCDGIGDALGSGNHQDMIYAGSNGNRTTGYINIYGGTFQSAEKTWLLNEADNLGVIKVYGGTFVNWNPSDNVSENPQQDFVAEGYKVVETVQANGDIWYTVVPMK